MIVEIVGEDTVRVHGATPEDAKWNTAQFQREFIAERYEKMSGVVMAV
ncbi:MAG: hypothetical protein MZV64_59690 [Ignavibacteriales bacterium]|nr:hypothetical protein [Ignavibacteriales bacterium]